MNARSHIPIEEVAKHRSAEDSWLVVDGKVYDVTSFVHQHPGGPLIICAGGTDATVMYHTYHFGVKARADLVLQKYYIGDFAGTSPIMGAFYEECSKRVAKKLDTLPNRGKFPLRGQVLFFLDAIVLLSLLAFSWRHFTIDTMTTPQSYLYLLLYRVFYFGVAANRWQQQTHALDHFMLFKSNLLTVILDHFMIFSGSASSLAFGLASNGNLREQMHLGSNAARSEITMRGPYEHQAIHHVVGGNLEEDGCRALVTLGGVFRLGKWEAKRPVHRFQGSLFFQGVVTTAAICFKHAILPVVGRINMMRIYLKNGEITRGLAAGGCLLAIVPLQVRLWVLPLLTLSWQGLACFVATAGVLMHFSLDNTYGHHFFAQHAWDISLSDETVASDWGRHNLETSLSFQPLNSMQPVFWFQNTCCPATLSYHVEHTLFPGVNYLNLALIAPVVEVCARDFGLSYKKIVGEAGMREYRQAMLKKYAMKSGHHISDSVKTR